MPSVTHLRGALRAIRHMQGAELALLLPPDAHQLGEIPGLTQVLAAIKEAHKDVTLVGGTPGVRAEAVAEGWRVSTSLEEWERWLAESQAVPTGHGWRIFRAAERPSASDEVVGLAATATAHTTTELAERLTSADQQEEAIIALIWQTGKLTEVPAVFYEN
ncbi:MAG: hypothetical protein H0X24_23275 [Ktedonobacterales bacterium]|nr:hypothetical protein [Ktedonobacterales bacterium]